MTFDERKEWLQNEHEALITRKNEPIEGNGVYERYKYPILTGEHAPLFWRYDFDRNANPYLMERFGIHAAFNSGAIIARMSLPMCSTITNVLDSM